jgi:hypothetical protein
MSLFHYHARAPFHFDWTRRRDDGSKQFPTPSAQEAVQASRDQASQPTQYPDTKKSDKARRYIISEPVRRKTLTSFQLTRKYGLAITRETCQEHAWAREVEKYSEEKKPSTVRNPRHFIKELRDHDRCAERVVGIDGKRGPLFDCTGLPDLPLLPNKKAWHFAHTQALTVAPDTRATPDTTDLGFRNLLRMRGPLQTSNLHKLQRLTVAMATDPREDGTLESTNPTLDLSSNHKLQELDLFNWKKLPAFPPLSAKAPIRKVSVVHCAGGIDCFPAALGECPELETIDWQGTPLNSLPEGIYTWGNDIKIKLTKAKVAPVLVAQIKARRADPNYMGPNIQLIDTPPDVPLPDISLESETARWRGRAARASVNVSHGEVSGSSTKGFEKNFTRFLFNAIDIEPREPTAERMSKLLYAMAKDKQVAIRCMQAADKADISSTAACADALVAVEAAVKLDACAQGNAGRKVGSLASEITRWRNIGKRDSLTLDFLQAGYLSNPAQIIEIAQKALAKFLFHAMDIRPPKACTERVNQILDDMAENSEALRACVVIAGKQKEFTPSEIEASLDAMQVEMREIFGANHRRTIGNFYSEAVRWLPVGSPARTAFLYGRSVNQPFVSFLFNSHNIRPHQDTAIRIQGLLEQMAKDREMTARCMTIAASSAGYDPQANEAMLQKMENAANPFHTEAPAPPQSTNPPGQGQRLWNLVAEKGQLGQPFTRLKLADWTRQMKGSAGEKLLVFVSSFSENVNNMEEFMYRLKEILNYVSNISRKRPDLVKQIDDIASSTDTRTRAGCLEGLKRIEGLTIGPVVNRILNKYESQIMRNASSYQASSESDSDMTRPRSRTIGSASDLDSTGPFAPSAPPLPNSDSEY